MYFLHILMLPLSWWNKVIYNELEACIDDERQFKTAKRPQAPGDEPLFWNGFSPITSLFFVVDRNE